MSFHESINGEKSPILLKLNLNNQQLLKDKKEKKMEIQNNTETNVVEVQDTYTPFQVTPKDFKGAFGYSCGFIDETINKFNKYLSENAGSIPFKDLDSQLFLFTDIETDGFAVHLDGLLEIFSSICAFNKVTKKYIRLVDIHVIYGLEMSKQLIDFDEWTLTNHSRSGLISDCIEVGSGMNKTYPELVTHLVKKLTHFSKAISDGEFSFNNKIIIAGSGVHYDYRWLTGVFTNPCKKKNSDTLHYNQISKEFEDILHYRLMDTTTFLLTKKLLGGDISKPKPEEILSSEELNNIASVEHRARYDTLQSIKLMENHIKDYGFSNSIMGN